MLHPAIRSLATTLALVLSTGVAQSAAINQISYGSVNGVGSIGFDAVPGGPILDEVVQIGAAQFGERFKGQDLVVSGLFDTLNATAAGPLSLVSGGVDKNLMLVNDGLAGLGTAGRVGPPPPPDCDPDIENCLPPDLSDDAIGEGAISILFDGDQSEFGFQLLGGTPVSKLVLAFFRIDGSLIEQITLNNLGDGQASFGFQRERGVKDIAGVSMWNEDDGGLVFDGLVFDVITARQPPGGTVPLPSALWLAGLGLAAVWGTRRR